MWQITRLAHPGIEVGTPTDRPERCAADAGILATPPQPATPRRPRRGVGFGTAGLANGWAARYRVSKARGIRRWSQPRDGLGRSRSDQPTQSGQRTRPHSGSIRDAGNKGTNAQAIIRTSAIYDHLRVSSSTCNDTPPSSFAGRSYTAGHHPPGTGCPSGIGGDPRPVRQVTVLCGLWTRLLFEDVDRTGDDQSQCGQRDQGLSEHGQLGPPGQRHDVGGAKGGGVGERKGKGNRRTAVPTRGGRGRGSASARIGSRAGYAGRGRGRPDRPGSGATAREGTVP